MLYLYTYTPFAKNDALSSRRRSIKTAKAANRALIVLV